MVRDKVETARALESLPAIASVAMEGGLSDEQLSSVVKLADEESDREWARRAPNVDPLELARQARQVSKPSAEDARARFAARELRMWRGRDSAMLQLRGQLPDDMGAQFEETITQLTEQMKPSKGEAWAPFEQRAADALVALCDPHDAADDHAPSLARSPVSAGGGRRQHGPAEIAGIPIADSLLEQLRANATIEPVLVDDHGVVLAIGRRTAAMSPKLRRAVLLRDTRCRMPGCARRRGLEAHHLVPRCGEATDEISNLAAVRPAHHRLLVPARPAGPRREPQPPRRTRARRRGRAPPLVPA